MTLLICPVRPGDGNDELRYAMRSWETNLHLGSELQLMTVGHCPPWVKPDLHVEGNRYKSVPLAVFDNIRIGAGEAVSYGRDEVIFMNDDFFCLDPQGSVLPVRRNQTLAQHIATFPENAGLWWPRSLRLTADWLTSEGYPSPWSYEVHRPLCAAPGDMLRTLNRWVDHAGGRLNDTVPQWRTIYGVLNEVEAHPVQDVKLGLSNFGVGSPWVSTSDQSWRKHRTMLVKRFQKPSRWEI